MSFSVSRFYAWLLLIFALCFQGCSETEDPQPVNVKVYQETILISENGAPQYPLREMEITRADYAGPLAQLEVTGKLNNGKKLSLSFSQTDPSVGANKTNVVDAHLDTDSNIAQASGTSTRTEASRTVNGSFKATFPDGVVIDGVLKEVKLPF